jgi:hypothetical protein
MAHIEDGDARRGDAADCGQHQRDLLGGEARWSARPGSAASGFAERSGDLDDLLLASVSVPTIASGSISMARRVRLSRASRAIRPAVDAESPAWPATQEQILGDRRDPATRLSSW